MATAMQRLREVGGEAAVEVMADIKNSSEQKINDQISALKDKWDRLFNQRIVYAIGGIIAVVALAVVTSIYTATKDVNQAVISSSADGIDNSKVLFHLPGTLRLRKVSAAGGELDVEIVAHGMTAVVAKAANIGSRKMVATKATNVQMSGFYAVGSNPISHPKSSRSGPET